jgi:hypothetical protein
MAQSERATQRPTAFRAPFHWDDPFLLEQQQITEDERIIAIPPAATPKKSCSPASPKHISRKKTPRSRRRFILPNRLRPSHSSTFSALCRRSKFSRKRLRGHPRISVAWSAAITKILGTKYCDERAPASGHLDRAASDNDVDGVFVAIAMFLRAPCSALRFSMRPRGLHWGSFRALRPPAYQVSFAAEDVADDPFRSAITAAGLGCMAAPEADGFLIRQGAGQDLASAHRSQSLAFGT